MKQHNRQHRAERSFPSQLNQLSAISDFVAEAAARVCLGQSDLFAIQTAVDEAATNIVLHGYGEELRGPIHIACWWEEEDGFVVEMRDRGRPFDPSSVPEPDLHQPLAERREGGLGIFMMRRMMDRVDFHREGEENVLVMSRRCAPLVGQPDNATVIAPKGRLDATVSAQLAEMLQPPIEGGQRFVVVDLAQVIYLSSSALRALLVAAKQLRQRGGNLLLCCPQPGVARVLHMTGFAEILPVYPTREATLRALEASHAPRV